MLTHAVQQSLNCHRCFDVQVSNAKSRKLTFPQEHFVDPELNHFGIISVLVYPVNIRMKSLELRRSC